MGWLIALGVLVLLGCLPLGVSVRYADSGLQLKILAGWIAIPLPKSKKEKKKKKDKKKEPKKSKKNVTARSNGTPEPEKKKGGSVTDFIPLVKLALQLLNDFRRKLRVRRLELKVILAGDDPCDLAINYGRAWNAVGNLMPRLERFLVIKKRDVEVECDFEASEILIRAQVDVTITLGRLLWLLVYYGVRGIKEFMKMKNLRKGGASK